MGSQELLQLWRDAVERLQMRGCQCAALTESLQDGFGAALNEMADRSIRCKAEYQAPAWSVGISSSANWGSIVNTKIERLLTTYECSTSDQEEQHA